MTLRNLVGALFWFSMLLVCWILLAQQADLPPLRIWDKAAHTLAFAALMLLSAVAYRPRLKLQWIALLLLGFGIGMEIVQHFLPYREFSFLDMVANGLGILLAMPLVIPVERLMQLRTT